MAVAPSVDVGNQQSSNISKILKIKIFKLDRNFMLDVIRAPWSVPVNLLRYGDDILFWPLRPIFIAFGESGTDDI